MSFLKWRLKTKDMKPKLIFFCFLSLLFLGLTSTTTSANHSPQLNNYGVQPTWAAPGTTVVFRLTYQDLDGTPPKYVRVYFNGAFHEMRKISGDYQSGAQYEYSYQVKSVKDNLENYFIASDGKTQVRIPNYQGGTLAPVTILSEKLDRNQIYLFARAKNTPLWRYATGSDWVQNLAISRDGQYLAVKTKQYLYLFSRQNSTPLWKYQCTGESGWVDIADNGEYIVGGCEQNLYLFKRESDIPLWSYKTEAGSVYSVAISANGQYIAAGLSGANEALLFSRENSTPLWKYKAQGDVHGLALSGAGGYLAAGSHCPDRRAYLFQKESNNPMIGFVASEGSPVWSAAISSNGQYAVYGLDSADSYPSIILFSPSQKTPLRRYTTEWWVRSLAMSSNGQYFAAGSGDHQVYLFNKDKSQPLWKYKAGERVGAVSMSEDGSYIAAGSKDKNIYLFSRKSNQPLWKYTSHHWINTVVVSGDGQYIAAGTGAGQYMAEGHNMKYNPDTQVKNEATLRIKGFFLQFLERVKYWFFTLI